MTDHIFTTQKIQEAFPNWTKYAGNYAEHAGRD